MKKLILIVAIFGFICNTSILNAEVPSFNQDTLDDWCFDTWTFVYDGAIAAGASSADAMFLAFAAFNTCVSNQQQQ